MRDALWAMGVTARLACELAAIMLAFATTAAVVVVMAAVLS